MTYTLHHGDCLEVMATLPDNCVDSVVTDPPYGLSFMGKKWDYDVPSVEIWREVFRVLKPGGHLLSFGGTRTYHRMVVNIEDAGFEIRDQIQWIYGSGFPKSLDVSKAIDKQAGAEREVLGRYEHPQRMNRAYDTPPDFTSVEIAGRVQHLVTAPATDSAKQWKGWGTALKPANEPICLARKPLEKGLTVAQNVLKWGTGAINVDGCRIETANGDYNHPGNNGIEDNTKVYGNFANKNQSAPCQLGRFPANVIHDGSDEVVGLFPLDTQRFFYAPKASKADRNAGLEGFEIRKGGSLNMRTDAHSERNGIMTTNPSANNHPTVKPTELMRYLCRLITPPNGTVLDPFAGSGSTGKAARLEGFSFIGIEREEEYAEIARARIAAVGGLFTS